MDHLRSWLTALSREGHSNFYVSNETTGDWVTVLMDEPYAAVLFTRGSDRLSFSASTDPHFEAASEADYHEFDVGGTPTPVSRDRCIGFDAMRQIVEHIFLHGELPQWVAWRQP